MGSSGLNRSRKHISLKKKKKKKKKSGPLKVRSNNFVLIVSNVCLHMLQLQQSIVSVGDRALDRLSYLMTLSVVKLIQHR